MSAPEPQWRPLGMLLVQKGLINEEQLEEALALQVQSGRRLGEVLVGRGFASRLAIQDALADQLGLLEEPPRGFGTGLRAKLVDREGRPGHTGEDGPQVELPANVVQLPMARPRQEPAALAREVDRLHLAVAARDERIAELEHELAAVRAAAAGSEAGSAAEHVVLVRDAGGYELVDAAGPPPRVGARVAVGERLETFVVLKVGRSPLPGDRRPCAFVEAAGAPALLLDPVE
jgi:hypothetical protein